LVTAANYRYAMLRLPSVISRIEEMGDVKKFTGVLKMLGGVVQFYIFSQGKT